MGSPDSLTLMPLKIARYDDEDMNKRSDEEQKTYKITDSNYSAYPFKAKLDPSNSWTAPFVTNHKYRIYFD